MNCLCCGKTLNNGGIDGWHKKCIKKFFGTNEIPEIDINKNLIEKIALEAKLKDIQLLVFRKNYRYICFLKRRKQDLLWSIIQRDSF